jgi:arylsulfatase A-like enzyme
VFRKQVASGAGLAAASVLLAGLVGCEGDGGSPDAPDEAAATPLSAFDSSAERALSRARALRERVEGFDPDDMLKTSAKAAPAFHYRLADKLRYATTSAGGELLPAGVLFEVGFDDGDAVGWVPDREPKIDDQLVIADGVLSVNRWYKHNFLRTDRPLDLDPATLGNLEIRARTESASRLSVTWDTAQAPFKVWHVGVDLIPDGEYHTYTVDLSTRLAALQERSTITGLVIRPTDVNKNTVDIDSVRVLDRRAAYSAEPAGAAHITAGVELRDAMFMNTPYSARYEVTLPDAEVFFQTGMSALLPDDPVTFRVELIDGDNTVELLERSVGDGEWDDFKTSLLPWAGRKVELALTVESKRNNVAFWGTPELYEPREAPLRVVFVLEDTERAHNLSAYGHSRQTTPFKDAFFADGVRFSRAFSQAPKTRPSCVSTLTSLLPRSTGVFSSVEYLPERYLTFQEILRSRGFATGTFTQNLNSGPSAGLHQGVDVMLDNAALEFTADTILNQSTLDWIAERSDRDLFLYLHLIDPHGPYDPPDDFRTWFTEGEGEPVERDGVDAKWVKAPTAEGRRGLYDGEIAYNDSVFKGFVEALGGVIPLEDTLFVFYSDHGEHQGEHGLWGHYAPTYRTGVQVPLMMRYGDRLPAGVVDAPVQLLDIVPTVLDLARADRQSWPLAGESLAPLLKGEDPERWADRLVLVEELPKDDDDGKPLLWSSLFFRDYHILYTNRLPTGDPEAPWVEGFQVFDFAADPDEQHPLSDEALVETFGVTAEQLRAERVEPLLMAMALENTSVRHRLAGDADQSIQLDADTLQGLREMGYVE